MRGWVRTAMHCGSAWTPSSTWSGTGPPTATKFRSGSTATATLPPTLRRRERIIRLLGAVGIRHGLADQTETSLDDMLAAVYLPPADEGDVLLAALPDGCHVLQLLIDPKDPACARWLWRDLGGTVRVGS